MPDWDTIRKEYETGEFSQSELAEKHGCTQQAISQRVRKEQWTKPDKELVARCSDLSLITDVDARNLGKRTPGNIAKFIELYSLSGNKKLAANGIGISESTAHDWCRQDKALVQLMAAKRAAFLSEQVHAIANAKDWQARKFILQHSEAREQFGDDRTDAGPTIVLQITRS